MVTIHVDNSHCYLECTSFEVRKAISEILSYEVEGAHFARRHSPWWDGRIRLLDKHGIFPTGLLGRVKTFLEKKKLPNKIIDTRRPEVPMLSFKPRWTTAEGKPLHPRPYQLAAANTSNLEHRGVYVMGTGCLTGDTEIYLNRAGKAFKTKLETAWLGHNMMHKNLRYNWDRTIPTKIRSLMGSEVRLNIALDFVQSGVKEVYSLELKNGFKIKATRCHRFMTSLGWKRLDELSQNDFIVCDLDKKPRGRKPKQFYRQIQIRNHPFAGVVKNRVPYHRAVAEARDSGLSLEEFVHRCRKNNLEGLVFYDSKEFAVHHIDHNHKNNSPENLLVCTHKEHAAIHGDFSNFQFGVPTPVQVKKIKYVGREMTYDVCCEGPHHNFIANKMVVHNSGKSLTSALVIDRHRVPTLFVTPDTGLKSQLMGEFLRWFGPRVVGGSLDECKPITVMNIQALARKKPEEFLRFKMLIIDEFHHCLKGDTKIETGHGLERIEDIYRRFKPGFKRTKTIKSWDGENWVFKPVTNVFKYKASEMLKIRVQDEDGKVRELLVTRKHKVFTDNGKIEAGSLRINDQMVLGYVTHAVAMRKRSKNKKYRDHLSERATLNNSQRPQASRESQRRKIKNLMASGQYNPYGRGEYGNGGQLTPTQNRVLELIGGEPEHAVTIRDGERPFHYRLDIALPEHKIAIEVDGSSHKNRKGQDSRKEERLRGKGWKVVRIPENCSKAGLLALKKLVAAMSMTSR